MKFHPAEACPGFYTRESTRRVDQDQEAAFAEYYNEVTTLASWNITLALEHHEKVMVVIL